MTPEIALTLLVIIITLVAFIREWAAPDVLALSILCLVAALGLVDPGKMTEVFKNEAPLTIAALFVIGARSSNRARWITSGNCSSAGLPATRDKQSSRLPRSGPGTSVGLCRGGKLNALRHRCPAGSGSRPPTSGC
jgi:hypothetical protein